MQKKTGEEALQTPKNYGRGESQNQVFKWLITIRCNHFSLGVGQMQTADWQVNIVVKCFNRFPIPKLDF